MRVLVVEDDPVICDFISRSLAREGFIADEVNSALAAVTAAKAAKYKAIIVDLGLPDRDGLELIADLRQQGIDAAFLILSARRSLDDRVRGLQEGDDYMTKPFATAELVARLKNLIRRADRFQPSSHLRVLDLELDLLRREATRGDRVLQLTPQEFALLEFLCRHEGRVVTRGMILQEVLHLPAHPLTNIVDVYIYRLRAKVDVDGESSLIRTLRGTGYVLRGR